MVVGVRVNVGVGEGILVCVGNGVGVWVKVDVGVLIGTAVWVTGFSLVLPIMASVSDFVAGTQAVILANKVITTIRTNGFKPIRFITALSPYSYTGEGGDLSISLKKICLGILFEFTLPYW